VGSRSLPLPFRKQSMKGAGVKSKWVGNGRRRGKIPGTFSPGQRVGVCVCSLCEVIGCASVWQVTSIFARSGFSALYNQLPAKLLFML
jgi:hypothetical protein